MGHSHSKHGPAHSAEEVAAASAADIKLPSQFTVWYQKSWTQIICYLGPYRDKSDNQALYCAQLPSGWFGRLVVFGGPDVGYPPLATIVTTNKRQTDVAVQFEGRMADEGGASEMIRYASHKVWHEVYWFAMKTENGVERFEWRRSHGAEVKSLGVYKYGWKLVRIGTRGAHEEEYEHDNGEKGQMGEHVQEEDEEEDKDGGSYGRTSDGKEVVAVWGDHKSLMKIGEFRFLNSGATGELGSRWAVMAVLSNLLIWQRTQQQAVVGAVS